jgi:dTDP-4-amino-4,6-dideoxygalactose transaminase
MKADWVEFESRDAKDGRLLALEAGREVPFPIARVYCVFAGDSPQVHGRHAHRRGEQVLVCLSGWCKVTLDDGHRRREFLLDRPDRGLRVGPLLWEEFRFASRAVLLALCDTPYDPADQIHSYEDYLALVSGQAVPAEPRMSDTTPPPIPFLDLKRVNDRYASQVTDAIINVRERGLHIGGPEVERFETEFAAYCGTRHCVAVGNGYDALRLMLRASGLQPGDEVLVPANTFVASILAIMDAGLQPVLVEPDPDTFLMDPSHAARCITSRTRAVLAVDLYGRCDGLKPLRELAAQHGLLLFEDAAQAHGASYEGAKAGSWGKAAAFSFYPTKNLGALGDAGAVTTDDDRLASDLRALRNYGAEHKNVHRLPGVNSRLDELQAAVLRVKLPYLDQDNARRRAIAHVYLEQVRNPQLCLPAAPSDPSAHVWHLFVVRCPRREALRHHLAARGIGTAVHYPTPPHHQPALAPLAHLSLPVTEQLHREVLSLPLHPALTEEQVTRVVEALNSF